MGKLQINGSSVSNKIGRSAICALIATGVLTGTAQAKTCAVPKATKGTITSSRDIDYKKYSDSGPHRIKRGKAISIKKTDQITLFRQSVVATDTESSIYSKGSAYFVCLNESGRTTYVAFKGTVSQDPSGNSPSTDTVETLKKTLNADDTISAAFHINGQAIAATTNEVTQYGQDVYNTDYLNVVDLATGNYAKWNVPPSGKTGEGYPTDSPLLRRVLIDKSGNVLLSATSDSTLAPSPGSLVLFGDINGYKAGETDTLKYLGHADSEAKNLTLDTDSAAGTTQAKWQDQAKQCQSIFSGTGPTTTNDQVTYQCTDEAGTTTYSFNYNTGLTYKTN